MPDRIDTPSLSLAWSETPWDTAITRYPVWQIIHLEVRGRLAYEGMKDFENIRDQSGVGLVSCRLPHTHLGESMFLEEHGFRFIEMLYQPELALVPGASVAGDATLSIRRALDVDLPAVVDVAGQAFVSERFHLDPRLGSELGNERYRNWVRNSFFHPDQRLYALCDGNRLVAFFVTEMQADGVCYWHLNAVAPEAQGLGYGRRAWQAMIRQAADAGAKRVRTSIVAGNERVLNLYARLGFRFPAPLMTFHWVRG
ncbi:MAG: GNAT family N-acetyltransferase [Gallionellaceae bacterium]|nr:GNAT family N-acetyltransferase [Gallionellaceae bacterium]